MYCNAFLRNTVAQSGEQVMGDKFVMSSRQASELDHAFERNGWTSADVKLLSTGDMLSRILPVIRDNSGSVAVKHLIDCDAPPLLPDDVSIKKHTRRGQIKWDPSQFDLHLSPNQQGGQLIHGLKLQKELEALITMNGTLADYLLEHPQLIPEEWKRDESGNIRYIFFWSTIFRQGGGGPCVRYLYFFEDANGGRGAWTGGFMSLGHNFGLTSPALVHIR